MQELISSIAFNNFIYFICGLVVGQFIKFFANIAMIEYNECRGKKKKHKYFKSFSADNYELFRYLQKAIVTHGCRCVIGLHPNKIDYSSGGRVFGKVVDGKQTYTSDECFYPALVGKEIIEMKQIGIINDKNSSGRINELANDFSLDFIEWVKNL